MKEAIFTMGLPASGKSTLINSLLKDERYKGFTLVSADEIRLAHPLYNPLMPHLIHEECVKSAENMMYVFSKMGSDLIMDGGGINRSYTKRIVNALKEEGYHITIYFVNTPPQICIKRNEERITKNERFVPPTEIIDKSYKLNKSIALLKPLVDEFIEIPYFTNRVIFCDMDGVLAEYQNLITDQFGDIDFVNFEVFRYAKPVNEVIKKLKFFYERGAEINILSASPNSICNGEKLEWLNEHVPFIPLENIYFAGNKQFKHVLLRQLIKKLKINESEVLVIDDEGPILNNYKTLGVNTIHPSSLLANF